MYTRSRIRLVATAMLASAAPWLTSAALPAQGAPARGPSPEMREAMRLDAADSTAQARAIFQRILDSTADPAAKAQVQRAIAISYAFDGDCANTVKYEGMAIAYWQTREQAEPQNAFYQEGELADEGARVCIDAGDLNTAEQWYRKGYALGVKEPPPKTHPTSLWDFRLAHAMGRLAARRGNRAEAQRQIATARRILDGDSALAVQQERFFPYLVGYVALYTNDLPAADSAFAKAIALRGNERDPFMHCLLAMTYEREGKAAEAKAMYEKAYGLAAGHNPPAAFVRPFVRKKLAAQ